MFQFPGFASLHYVFMQRYPLPGGLPHSDIHGSTPARGSPWLFAACHVLHRLLVPRHPPNALLILDIFDVAPRSRVHHAQKPSSDSVVRVQSSVVRKQLQSDHRLFEDSPGNIYSAHNRILSNRFSANRLRGYRERSDKIVHNASEPSPPTVGALSSQTAIPGQTIRPNDAPVLRGQWSRIRTGSTSQTHAPTPADDAPRDAPEPDSHSKEQRDHPRGRFIRRHHTTQNALPEPHDQTEFGTFRDTNR